MKKLWTKIFRAGLCILASKWKQFKYHRETDKQTVIFQHNGILFGNKKERTTDINNKMDDSRKHYEE